MHMQQHRCCNLTWFVFSHRQINSFPVAITRLITCLSVSSQILVDLKRGANWKATAKRYLPNGSFANGGAMRIAPVGLMYRNSSRTDLEWAVEVSQFVVTSELSLRQSSGVLSGHKAGPGSLVLYPGVIRVFVFCCFMCSHSTLIKHSDQTHSTWALKACDSHHNFVKRPLS